MNSCPECKGRLAEGAVKCRCGWKAEAIPEFRTIQCEANGCTQHALVRMADGSSLCAFHSAQWWTPERILKEKRVTDNPHCKEIREAYAKRGEVEDSEMKRLGEYFADKLAA